MTSEFDVVMKKKKEMFCLKFTQVKMQVFSYL